MRAATVVALLIQKNSHTSTRLLGAFKTRRKNGRNSNLNDDHHQSHKHRTVACALFILDCLLNCAVALQLPTKRWEREDDECDDDDDEDGGSSGGM